MTSALAAVARRPRGAGRVAPRAWRQELRLQPWTLFAVAVALGIALAADSRLDVTIERSLLVLVTTIALSVVVVDPAEPLTSASPTPLVLRRLTRATIAVGVLAGSWVTILVVVSLLTPPPAEPAPWWASTLEWATVAGTQLALAATHRPDGNSSRSIGAGAFLALVWFAAIQAAPAHARLYPVADHTLLWVSILCASGVVVAMCSTDPARRRGRWRGTGRRTHER